MHRLPVRDGIDTQETERKNIINKPTNKLILQLTIDTDKCIAGFPRRDITSTGKTFPTTKHPGL
jgi:hypothetical protein